MMIYTFYSYKGGVGRTMALANVAELFYHSGLKVLMVDWDLEAPGLERFFEINLEDVLDRSGVMDLLLRYKEQMAQELPAVEGEGRSLPFKTPKQFAVDVYPNAPGEGRLWLLTAGRRSKAHLSTYAHALRTFDWQDFYQNWEGELYFEWLRQQFEQMADVILIDSRTGVTEMGGICTYQLADTVVMFCIPNQQSLDGIYKMAQDFTNSEVQGFRRGRPLDVLIIPARIERAESDLLDEFQEKFITLFESFAPGAKGVDIQQLWDLSIPYIPKYAYEEAVAVRESGRASAEDMAVAFRRLGQAMSYYMPEPVLKKMIRQPLTGSYNLENIRALLIEGFTGEELRRFCFDAPSFRNLHEQLDQEARKVEVIHQLIEYGNRRLQLDNLLAWAREQNPARYEKHQPYVGHSLKVG